MSKVYIPAYTKKSKRATLARCLDRAAEMAGVDTYTMAVGISGFLEEVAEQVTKGNDVVVPGFGAWFPVADKRPRGGSKVRRCRVRWHASAGFQQQVKYGAVPQDSMQKRFEHYRDNHTAGDNSRGIDARVFKSMQKIRESLAAQLAHARDLNFSDDS